MKSRTIVFTEAYKAELIERDVKELGDDEVLIKMMVFSISAGTERANFIGEPNVNIYSNCAKASFPRIVGYSSAGVVEKTGKNVTDLKPGDRVAMSGSKHSEYMVMHKDYVHKIESEDISYSEAALWYISCFPAAAIRSVALSLAKLQLLWTWVSSE